MGLNLSNLETVLQNKVDGLTSSSTDKDVLLTSKSIEAATADVTVSDVITEGGTQVTAINSAASTKVGEVNTAGGTQVTAVNNAGTAQIALVNAIDTYTKAEANAKIIELSPPATKAHVESLGISASTLTGSLPAISGANLTNLPVSGATDLNGLSDVTVSSSDPTESTDPSAVGHLWINKTSGEQFVATDVTTGANIWSNTGEGTGNIGGTFDIFGDNSAVALYRLDGNTNDSGGAYNDTASGITYTTGKDGQAGTFTGSASMTTSLNVGTNFSISFWVKTGDFAPRNTPVMTFGNNLYFTAGGAGGRSLSFHEPGQREQTMSTQFLPNVWEHVVFTFTSLVPNPNVNQKYYINGSLHTYGGQTGSSFSSFSGGFAINGGVEGSIEQLRIFNREVTANEAYTLYTEV